MEKNNNTELTNAEKKEIKQEVKEKLKNQESNDSGIDLGLKKHEKVRHFFDGIEFLGLDNEQKEEVALKVKEDASGDKLYWIEIFLSSLIAAFGLLQNSVAVVIGAMLIAPLLRPINGVSFAIARGAQNFFTKAFKTLLLSVLASIFMGVLVAFLVGLNIETAEILARSKPNIIDFFIAIFSAMVAVMSLRFTRLGESIAGVAMAASLMPPLVVVGIALAMLNTSVAFGAMMLFLTNLVAIILVGTVFFWLYGYTPHMEKQQKSMMKRLSFVIILIIIITIPLISSFLLIREEVEVKNQFRNYFINKIGSSFSITDIEVKSIKKNNIVIKSTIKVPENKDISNIIKKVNEDLSGVYGKSVELDLEVIRVVNIKSEK